jgi:hypothetical protein
MLLGSSPVIVNKNKYLLKNCYLSSEKTQVWPETGGNGRMRQRGGIECLQ